MLRNLLAVVAAFVVGNVLIFAGEAVNMLVFPTPDGVDFNDPEAIKSMVAAMPIGAFLGVELSYVVASVGAGAVVAKLAASRRLGLAIAVGGLFTFANLMNMASIPHPMWFAGLTTLTFIPVAAGAAQWLAPRPE